MYYTITDEKSQGGDIKMEKSNSIGIKNVIVTSGFWHKRKIINADTTIYSVLNRFIETGRFEALKCQWKEGDINKPHIFWDSDIAKWLEGAAYILLQKQDEKLIRFIDETIDTIEQNQDEFGYFNSYFNVTEQDQRFQRRTDHELYCAGHLIEAAVAYYEVTGKDKFLKMMCKYADYINRVFRVEDSAGFVTPGHAEIELALIRLYSATGNRTYLELSKFFVDQHGNNEKDKSKFYEFANPNYTQDHLPVREQKTAEGHAVRAVYLYNAMVDLSIEFLDQPLFEACKSIFENIINKRMYITGGIGSTDIGEAFTIDYDLPNQAAYAETCAALGLALFAHKMSFVSPVSIYADIAEKALYNGFLSGLSLDGKSFFYENPLEIDPKQHEKNSSTKSSIHLPIMQRKEVFDCSCCPPNVLRFIASLENMLYSKNEDTVFVHHYMSSQANLDGLEIVQETEYPSDGKIHLQIKGECLKMAIRIPGWCSSFQINKEYMLENGYAYINLSGDTDIQIHFEMKVLLMESTPFVHENAGRIAVTRGPLVYCLEGVDCGENLSDISIDMNATFEVRQDEYFNAPVLLTKGYRRNISNFKGLYMPAENNYIQQDLKLIPYFGFANRGVSEMLVWILKK